MAAVKIKQQAECNKDFAGRILEKFKAWTMKGGYHPTQENLIKFLIRHSFIDVQIINRFLVLEYYAEELPKTKTQRYARGRKQIAVWNIEERLPVGETQIKSTVQNHPAFFREKYNKFP